MGWLVGCSLTDVWVGECLDDWPVSRWLLFDRYLWIDWWHIDCVGLVAGCLNDEFVCWLLFDRLGG